MLWTMLQRHLLAQFLHCMHTETAAERLLPEDWDHFHTLLEQMLHRVPSLGDAVFARLCNGPEAFSPDGKWIVGEAPEVSS
jgi:pyruvate dehydrogenase phosphatase regulatory subunit